MWLDDIVSIFLQGFYIWIIQTKVTIFEILLHCQCLLCFAQIVASNWFKFIIYIWSPIITIVYGILSLFHKWNANVLVGEHTCGKSPAKIPIKDKGKCPKLFDYVLWIQWSLAMITMTSLRSDVRTVSNTYVSILVSFV